MKEKGSYTHLDPHMLTEETLPFGCKFSSADHGSQLSSTSRSESSREGSSIS